MQHANVIATVTLWTGRRNGPAQVVTGNSQPLDFKASPTSGKAPNELCAKLSGRSGISLREQEVLVLLGLGMTVPEVAAQLYRSPKTIERHKSSISKKLGTRRQCDLVEIVTSLGLELDDLQLKRLHH
jgi:DNA-binding NarL/FixJ family response regulator